MWINIIYRKTPKLLFVKHEVFVKEMNEVKHMYGIYNSCNYYLMNN